MRSLIGMLLAVVALCAEPLPLRAERAAGQRVERSAESPGDAKKAEEARVQEMHERHHQAALVVGGAMLALLLFTGMLRLDEATHGYYSGRLFAVAAILVTLIGFGTWWFM